MLNWRVEEEKYVETQISEYRQSITALQMMFMSKKTLDKNIIYISQEARLKYRRNKLDTYMEEIEKERKRIDELVDKMNKKFDEYMSNQQHIISKNIKPFRLEAKPYDNLSKSILEQLEIVTIQCEPLKLAFLQEKI